MILVRKNILSFNDTSYTCAIGKNGITSRKKEGDGCTPLGEYSLGTIYFRKDKVVLPKLNLPIMVIDKNTGWCDDVNSYKYNKGYYLSVRIQCLRSFLEMTIFMILFVVVEI
jgi:L,D-peptidoglycan transpeptidase YkuD (ErfK/YbiS/YcfS/YnhG family)